MLSELSCLLIHFDFKWSVSIVNCNTLRISSCRLHIIILLFSPKGILMRETMQRNTKYAHGDTLHFLYVIEDPFF